MTHSESIYDSPRLAAGYAYHRPPVHPHIIRRIGELLHCSERYDRALDIGCGAGLSTAALAPLARSVFGLEPVAAMLRHSCTVAPNASFIIGRAERLPFASEAFDLITAAGALNYTDLELFLPEAERVLTHAGALVIYDFSAGRRIEGSDRLDEWYAEFERRYPPPPGYELDIRKLPYGRVGLELAIYEELKVTVPMTFDSYLLYALSETGAELAIARGLPERELTGWCHATLAEVFGDASRDVIFDAYIATVRRAGSK